MNIYVGNLSKDVTDEILNEAFSKFGKVSTASVIKDMFSQESKGFGFVEMPSNTEAEEAIKELNASELNGKGIIVNQAKPKRDRSSKGRRY